MPVIEWGALITAVIAIIIGVIALIVSFIRTGPQGPQGPPGPSDGRPTEDVVIVTNQLSVNGPNTSCDYICSVDEDKLIRSQKDWKGARCIKAGVSGGSADLLGAIWPCSAPFPTRATALSCHCIEDTDFIFRDKTRGLALSAGWGVV